MIDAGRSHNPVMSYDLAVWDGDRPATDEAALAAYLDLYDRYIDVEELAPPRPSIQRYVAALLERWPDLEIEERSPWSTGSLMGNASGPIIYFAMVYSQAREASAWAAEVADSHGLVCFDPQQRRLRP
jgi:hypothetical protein